MTNYDLFNGDADGICALHQLRLAYPKQAELITGLKRDINLFDFIQPKSGDEITALDISFDKNRDGVVAAVESGASVFYADHHFAGEIPEMDLLEVHIDTTPMTCTSLIIDEYLQNQHTSWAIVGAYGDNFADIASSKANNLGFDETQISELKQLGECLNYNGYGFELSDLIFHPKKLYQLVSRYKEPLDFIQNESGYLKLKDSFLQDMESAAQVQAQHVNKKHAMFFLPSEKWAKRVIGVLGNQLCVEYPDRAHALLIELDQKQGYRVSIRAPYNDRQGADELCRQFEGGGGRQAAAGINQLPFEQMERFTEKFDNQFG